MPRPTRHPSVSTPPSITGKLAPQGDAQGKLSHQAADRRPPGRLWPPISRRAEGCRGTRSRFPVQRTAKCERVVMGPSLRGRRCAGGIRKRHDLRLTCALRTPPVTPGGSHRGEFAVIRGQRGEVRSHREGRPGSGTKARGRRTEASLLLPSVTFSTDPRVFRDDP